MLPILLYPVTIPVLIAGVKGTSALLQAEPSLPTATVWLVLLASFDIVSLTLALWTFEPLMTE
jgi:ABC-type transport system involved in cytochrome c biogenesis permease component